MSQQFCPSCGTRRPEGERFCGSCGRPFAEDLVTSPPGIAPKKDGIGVHPVVGVLIVAILVAAYFAALMVAPH